MVDPKSRVFYLCLIFWWILCVEREVGKVLALGEERIALLELRSSLGLRALEWPIKKNPCTDWVGISCSAVNSRVIGINISGFRRTRRGSQNPLFSVDALQNLTSLESFNASSFRLPGSIPDWFGVKLRSLQVLDLRSCGVTGNIPSTFGNLSSLSSLILSDNRLVGSIPVSLGQLSRLSVLDLSRNSLTGDVPDLFSSLGNLTWLDMSLNDLQGEIPPGIGKLSLLKMLNLSGNSLSSSIPAQLGDLGNLFDLDLSNNELVGPLLSELGGLRSLKSIRIGGNSLSGVLPEDLFPSLTQLQFLAMDHANFSGNFPEIFWSMPQLQFLDASGNNFTGILPDVGPNVSFTGAVFNLSRNIFFGNLTTVIKRFSFIDLSANYFQGTVPDYALLANVSLSSNCLDNSPNQRNQGECSLFYSGRTSVLDIPSAKSGKRKRNIILVAVLGGVALLSLLVFLVVLLCVCKRKRGATQQRGTVRELPPAGATPPLPGVPLNFSSLGDSFTYQQILQATGEFSDENLIKHGHSGDLFKGILEGGIHVIIKKVDLQSVKKEAYMSELDIFCKVSSHPRLVPLLGHCLENENEKFVVYKYMPHRDLSSSLFRKTNADGDSLKSLDWITRLKIAIGAAEGLSYLHHDFTPPLVHRDVQASSILLDDKFEVRLGSLSDVCTQEGDSNQRRFRLLRLPQTSEQGNSGTPSTTCAYDVYCFGKVLLELVTGKLGVSASNDATVKEWLDITLPYINIYDKELVTNIIDPSLIIDEDLLEEVWAMAIVARSCLNPRASKRPLMRYILKALENPLKVVREEHTSSARLRTTSSRGSWNAALFGSWRHSSSDVAAMPTATASKMEGGSSFKHSGTSASQGSGQIGEAGHSSSTRRHSNEIFPEPIDERSVEQPPHVKIEAIHSHSLPTT